MSELATEHGGTGPSHRALEIGVAAAMAVLALIGVYGSLAVGIGWAAEGPQAGFFPFYVSLFVLLSSAVNIFKVLIGRAEAGTFASWSQLRQVFSVLLPTTIYVLLIPYLGMYVVSAVLITFFMAWFGKYRWIFALAIGIGVPVLTFFMFELWFLVPLPKGPLEKLLGY